MRNPSARTAPEDVTREVALKAIPKKEGKGNKESMWSEMQVLQGLSIIPTLGVLFPHLPLLHDMMRLRACPRLPPNMFGCRSVGQILQMVRLPDIILPRFRARCQQRVL